MDRRVVREIGRFAARDTSGGAHTIVALRTFILSRTIHDDNVTEVPGMWQFRTPNGRPVNRLEKGKFQLLDGDLTVTADAASDPIE